MDELERCDREIAEIETLLRSGHPDVQGLCLALADWNAERRSLKHESVENDPVDVHSETHQFGKENPLGT
jgi:hypothetical protein